jgi:cell division protein FtsW (lipid II flippase)
MLNRYERWLSLVLWISGAIMLLALAAAVMPYRQIALIHQWLGLGRFPHEPIAEYLARLASCLYALLGGLAIVLGTDVRASRRAISYLAVAFPAASALMLATCWNSGMPLLGLLTDLGSTVGFAGTVLALQYLAHRPGAGVP